MSTQEAKDIEQRAHAEAQRLYKRNATPKEIKSYAQTQRYIAMFKRACSEGTDMRRAMAVQEIDKSRIPELKTEIAAHIGQEQYDRLAKMHLILGFALPSHRAKESKESKESKE